MFWYKCDYNLTKGTKDSRCWDVRCVKDFLLPAGERVLVPTSLFYRVKPEVMADMDIVLRPRSGLANKGVMLLAGELDSDYQNEVGVILYNCGREELMFYRLDRIAQLKLSYKGSFNVEPIRVSELPNFPSLRTGGFGSTGIV